ncbi:MAG: hypothetical protein CVU34_14325 [Betaproteobacteria bacterium HGW-Betaproteobacteria-7]|nr:MAG: hypothetical protein CVU34_14325 [Betaproteobacteria bacterium HGW-Betaproteobacteria-7]
MAEAGAALVSSAAATATQPAGSATELAVAVRYPSSKPGPIAALQLQYGLPAGSGVRSRWPAAQIQPEPPLGAAKTSALMLSSLGMIGVISLLRLGRAP